MTTPSNPEFGLTEAHRRVPGADSATPARLSAVTATDPARLVDGTHRLRVLIANQRADRLAVLEQVVAGLGHEVIAHTIDVRDVAALTARARPDIALVGLGASSTHALELISEITRGAFCPVIALLGAYDADWLHEAAERGIWAYIVDTRPEELQSSIEITLRRYAEHQDIQGAFDRRNADILRSSELMDDRRRRMLELHDGVVQTLTMAELALDLGRVDESRDALVRALENARTSVSRSLSELRDEGFSLVELLRVVTPAGG
jgi:AmiR/NasT family two-component response regulator